MIGRSRRRALVVAALAAAMSLGAARASAQSPEDLQAARELFQDAFKDEQEKRYADALDKFQRVAKVKESASVRYRIATVLVAMGRHREARDMYRALAASKPSLAPNDHETADSAAERAAELDRRIPRLSLRLQDNPPPDVRVTVDGAPVPVSTTPRSIELDPGDHIVAAAARGTAPTEQTITLTDGGGEVAHTVIVRPEAPPPVPAPEANRTLGWITLGGGAALLVTGSLLLVAREGAIDDIKAACPGGICPTSRRADVEGDRDRAQLFGPLGGTLAIVGAVAMGAGVYLLVRPAPTAQPATTSVRVTVKPSFGGLRLALTF